MNLVLQITLLIGEGAAGEVYRASYHGNDVAFKKYKFLGSERERKEDVVEKIIYSEYMNSVRTRSYDSEIAQ